MAESNIFKPSTSGSGLGKKKDTNGQFVNPPEYPATGGFTGSGKTGGKSGIMSTQKTPSAKSGKV